MAKSEEDKSLDRRGFLHCMAWVGTGALWTMSGGVLKGDRRSASRDGRPCRTPAAPILQFRPDQRQPHRVRQAREHGRHRDAPRGDREDQGRARSRPRSCFTPAISRTCRSRSEFDTLQQILSELSVPVFYVPGEHDVLEDDGRSYLERFGKGTQGAGLAQLRSGRRALHRPRQRRQSEGRRTRARSAPNSSNGSRRTSSV